MTESTDHELDDQALADAADEGARAPDWLVHDDVSPPDEAAAIAAKQELQREIDPATRARIVDGALDALLGHAPAQVVPIARGRRWLWALPVLAAAAAVLLLVWPGEAPVPDIHEQVALVGSTHLRPGIRGDAAPGELHLAADGDFYLECAPGLRDFTVTAVRAVRGADVRTLDFKQTATDGAMTELYVHAALSPGRWAVQCGVSTGPGRFAWLDPPAPLIVE